MCVCVLVQMRVKRAALTPGAVSLLQKGRRLTEHTLNTCQLKRVKAAAVSLLISSSFHSPNSFIHSFIHAKSECLPPGSGVYSPEYPPGVYAAMLLE